MSEVGDAEHVWKTYRDRTGYGNLLSGGADGISGAPGYDQVCLEPVGFCDEDPRKNLNGALGVDQMEPHAIRRDARRCVDCHLDEGASNQATVSAVYGWNPDGYTSATSAYLSKIQDIQTAHGSYDTADGFVIADDGISHRLDWMVDEETGYPLVSSPHVRTDAGRGYETYDSDPPGRSASG